MDKSRRQDQELSAEAHAQMVKLLAKLFALLFPIVGVICVIKFHFL